MNGGVTFREALQERLDIIRPDRKLLKDFLINQPHALTPGIV